MHQSGIGEYLSGATDYAIISEADLVRRVLSEPLAFRPGSQFGYSNNAYNLLAVIVGRASGRSYFDYVERSVFRPAGIRATFDPSAFPEVTERRTANGWTELRRTAAARAGPFWGLWGAGGAYMSARDLARLMDAFVAGEVLPLEQVRSAREPLVPLNEMNAGGVVWGLVREGSGWTYYFNGESDHSSADIRGDPDRRVTLAVVANSDRPNALRAGRLLARGLGAIATERGRRQH